MKNALKFADGVIFGEDAASDEVKKFAQELEIPTLNQYAETDYLSATDEFFDHVLSVKPVLA